MRLQIVKNKIECTKRLEKILEKDKKSVRYLVRKERFREIDRRRRLENVERRKVEARIQVELTRVEREALGQAHIYAVGRQERPKWQTSIQIAEAG